MTPPNDLGALPYEVHTNRELEFMVHRGKPLAHFCDGYPSEPVEEIFPERAFAPYVESGKFVAREFIEFLQRPPPAAHPEVRGIRHLFYARSAEAWRIDAYIMMMAAAAKAGWSEGFERLQGSLLGYEEWQTDIHVERLRADPNAKKILLVAPVDDKAALMLRQRHNSDLADQKIQPWETTRSKSPLSVESGEHLRQ